MEHRFKKILTIIPLLSAAAIVPLIARAAFVPFFDHLLSPFPLFKLDFDVFAWCKLIALIAISLIILLTVIIRFCRTRKYLEQWHWFPVLTIFVLFICLSLSAIGSKYWATAVWGFPGHYEGYIAFSSYFLLFIYSAGHVWDSWRQSWLVWSLLGLAVIISTLCILQFYGVFLLDRGVLRSFIFGSLAKQKELIIAFTTHHMTATLYNPNVVGSFVSLLAPLAVVFCLYSTKLKSAMFFIIAELLFIVTSGCRSRAGLLGVIAALIFSFILYLTICKISSNKVKILKILILSIAFAATFTIIGHQSKMYQKMGSGLDNDLKSFFINTEDSDRRGLFPNSILVKGGIIFLKNKGVTVILRPEGSGFSLYAPDGTNVTLTNEGSRFFATREEYKELSIELKYDADGKRLISLDWPPYKRDFVLGSEGFKIMVWGVAHESEVPEVIDYLPNLGLFSNRGYIWSRSLPMLKNTVFLGQGFGTFAFHFPQRDFNGKQNYFGKMDVVVEKPHNMYLQYALGGGIIFLLVFLILTVWIFWNGIKFYIFKEKNNPILPGLLAACLGYLTTAVFNDSMIFVAPIFWVIFGTITGIITTSKETYV